MPYVSNEKVIDIYLGSRNEKGCTCMGINHRYITLKTQLFVRALPLIHQHILQEAEIAKPTSFCLFLGGSLLTCLEGTRSSKLERRRSPSVNSTCT